MKQAKETYDQLAEEYSEVLVDKDKIRILDTNESDKMYTEFCNSFPFDSSGSTGRIVWGLLKESLNVKSTHELYNFTKMHQYEGSHVYLLRKFSISKDPPVIETTIENVLASFADLLDEEQFIFCPSKGYVIDIPFSGIITVGIK
jgi:hypothetical protein